MLWFVKAFGTLLVLVLWGAVGPGVARGEKEDSKAAALRAFESGMAAYKQGDYDGAIARFEEGYRAAPQAVFLYNIAQAHRMAGRPAEALTYYRRYLRDNPGASNFYEVKERIRALEKEVEAPASATTSTSTSTPVIAPTPVVVAAEPPPGPAPGVAKKRRVWPIVVGVVGGVVGVGLAVGLGVGLGTRGSQTPIWQPVMP